MYYAKGAELDHHKILTKIRDTGDCDFPFQIIARNFRMIESNMLPIIVPFDDVAKENLEFDRFSSFDLTLLGHYSIVSLFISKSDLVRIFFFVD